MNKAELYEPMTVNDLLNLSIDSPYGIATKAYGDQYFNYIIGTDGDGFLIRRDKATDILSPEAIDYGLVYDDYLAFPRETTASIVIYECTDEEFIRDFFDSIDKLELLIKLPYSCEQYTKECFVTPYSLIKKMAYFLIDTFPEESWFYYDD